MSKSQKVDKDDSPHHDQLQIVQSKTELETIVNDKALDNILICVEYHSDTCLPCHRIDPHITDMRKKYAQEARFYRVDVDASNELAKAAGVELLPTFHFFQGGKWISDLVGADSYKLEQAIETHLKRMAPVSPDQGKPIELRCTKLEVSGEYPPFETHQAFFIKDQLFIMPCTYEIEQEEEDSEEEIVKYLDRVYIFNLATSEWRSEKVSGEAPFSVPLQSVSIGSHIYTLLSDFKKVYVLDTDTFTWHMKETTGSMPSTCHGGRKGFTLTAHGKHIYLFGGGCDEQEDRFKSMSVLNTDTFVWSELTTLGKLPPERQYHTATERPSELVVFGGEGGGAQLFEFNDVFVYDFISNHWREVEINGLKPKPRIHHSSCLINGQLLITGGKYDYKMLQDWDPFVLDFNSNVWIKPSLTPDSAIPPAVIGHYVVPLTSKKVLLVGGNDDEETLYHDIYVIELASNE